MPELLQIFRPKQKVHIDIAKPEQFGIAICSALTDFTREKNGTVILDENFNLMEVLIETIGSKYEGCSDHTISLNRAFKIHAKYVIMYHTHPEGSTTVPSETDLKGGCSVWYYNMMKSAYAEMGITIINNVIASSEYSVIRVSAITAKNFEHDYQQITKVKKIPFNKVKDNLSSDWLSKVYKNWGIYNKLEKQSENKFNAEKYNSTYEFDYSVNTLYDNS